MNITKSVSLKSPEHISICDIDYPQLKANQVLIKTKSVGICGSDIGAYRGTNPLVSYPRIIGHEIVGEVLAGDNLPSDIKIGEHVIVDPYIYCGKCYPCKIGRTNCCQNLQVIGVHIDGGMREFFTHPAKLIHKIPKEIEIKHAPLAEPLTIALHALHRTKLKAGEHVVIIGAGAIGIMMALTAIHYGAIPIIIDIVDERLAYAKTLGIKHTFNSTQDNCLEEIKILTNNNLAEVVIEASGANQSIRNTLDFVSFAGRIALTGWPKTETSLPTNLITFKEVDIVGSRTSVNEFKEALDLLAKKIIDPKLIISKIIPIDDVPAMIKQLAEHPEQQLKVHAVFN